MKFKDISYEELIGYNYQGNNAADYLCPYLDCISEIYKYWLHDNRNNTLPVNLIRNMSGYTFKQSRPYTTFMYSGTIHPALYPANLLVKFCNHCNEILHVDGMFSLDSQYYTIQQPQPMIDAIQLFMMIDKINSYVAKKEKEESPKTCKENIELGFEIYLENIFKSMFKTLPEDVTIIDMIRKNYLIRVEKYPIYRNRNKELCYRPIVHVISYNSDDAKWYIPDEVEFAIFNNKYKNVNCSTLFFSVLTPLVIASAYHTAFRQMYEQCQSNRRKIEEYEELDDTITTW